MEFECPDGWRRVRLSELGEVNRGRSRHRPRYAEHLYGGPYPFVQTGDIRTSGGRIASFTQTYSEAGLAQSRLWPAGTMCITIAANIAETAILSFPACFPDSVVGFIAEPNKAEVKFIEYMFRFMRKRIQHQATGSVQDNINLETLERLHFPLPPLAEQKAIAAVLGALDDKIELNRRTNSTLETMARALFQSWFVDFDPVRAKLDGRKSDGLDKSTAALFPSHLVHESGGVAPQGWSQRRWGDIATLEYGKSLRDYRDSAGRYRVYGTNGPIGFHDEALCENAGIIIGRKGAYRGVHYSPEPFFVIDTAFYLKPKAPIDLRWAYYELLRFDINGMDSGSAIPSTSRDDFYGIPVIVPTPEIQTAFGAIVGGWFAKTSANDRESQTLATLRDTLLPKLLSGELSAKWAIENLEATRWAKR